MAKMKAWRAAGRKNTIDGTFTARQIKAFQRHQMKFASALLVSLLGRLADNFEADRLGV